MHNNILSPGIILKKNVKCTHPEVHKHIKLLKDWQYFHDIFTTFKKNIKNFNLGHISILNVFKERIF